MRFVVPVVLAACVGGSEPVPPAIETSGTVKMELPIGGNQPVDILVVIDNSPAMAAHQERLQTNLRRFAQLLHPNSSSFLWASRWSLRLGVVTTDLGGADCGPGEAGVLRGMLVEHVADNGITLRNYQGDLGDALVKLGSVGTTGCANTQPLAAAKRAIERGELLRDTSGVVILFITAGDAHEESIEGYEAFFKSLRDDYRLFVGGILGIEDGKLPALIERFRRGVHMTIAEPDWSLVLAEITARRVTLGGPPCLEVADVDPIAPNEQHACEVWYEFPLAAHHVPACDETDAGPCWKLVADRQYCFASEERVFRIERPLVEIPSEARLTIECVSR